MKNYYQIEFNAKNANDPEFLANLILAAEPCALTRVEANQLFMVTDKELGYSGVTSTKTLAKECCRLVIQGQLTLANLNQIYGQLETQIVRTQLHPDLFKQQSLGAITLGLAAKPSSLESLQQLAQQNQWELNLLEQHPSLYKPGVLLMDMDSTAIQIECIDEIAVLAGVGEQVAEVTELAMQGKLDFAESLKGRVATLKGADEAILEQVRQALPMTQGLPELVTALRAQGWKAAIASGGFTYFADFLKETLPFDAAFANVLEIEDGMLTGQVVGGIVDAQKKAEVMRLLVEEYGIEPGQAVAAGDGANDLVMMAASDLGVAFHAKPIVAAQATTALNYQGLEGIYYLLASAPQS